MISEQQLNDYRDRGFLVLEGFASEKECDKLRARAEELVQEFDPAEVVSVFSTRNQKRSSVVGIEGSSGGYSPHLRDRV